LDKKRGFDQNISNNLKIPGLEFGEFIAPPSQRRG
jgi:hypothetical protein